MLPLSISPFSYSDTINQKIILDGDVQNRVRIIAVKVFQALALAWKLLGICTVVAFTAVSIAVAIYLFGRISECCMRVLSSFSTNIPMERPPRPSPHLSQVFPVASAEALDNDTLLCCAFAYAEDIAYQHHHTDHLSWEEIQGELTANTFLFAGSNYNLSQSEIARIVASAAQSSAGGTALSTYILSLSQGRQVTILRLLSTEVIQELSPALKSLIYYDRLAHANYRLTTEHLIAGVDYIPSIPSAPDEDPEDLMNLFAMINFTEPNAAHYIPYATDEEAGRIGSVELRSGLEEILTSSRSVTGLPGMYGSDWYEIYHKIIKHITKLLKDPNLDRDERDRHLCELSIAGRHCGSRQMQQALNTYLDLNSQAGQRDLEAQTLENILLRKLRDLRFSIIQSMAADCDSGENSVIQREILELIGSDLGLNCTDATEYSEALRGFGMLSFFALLPERRALRLELLQTFYEIYTPEHIVQYLVTESSLSQVDFLEYTAQFRPRRYGLSRDITAYQAEAYDLIDGSLSPWLVAEVLERYSIIT